MIMQTGSVSLLFLWLLHVPETRAFASVSPPKITVVAPNLHAKEDPLPSVRHSNNIRPSRRISKRIDNNLKPGAYHDVTEDELYDKTMDLLQNCGELGEMTAGQAHEAGRLLIAWSKRYVPQSGEMSELMLKKLVTEKAAGNEKAKPGVNLFNSCMNAWIKCGKANGYQNALDLLEDLNEYLQTYTKKSWKKQDQVSKCYSTIIAGCCSSKTRSSADIAFELLEKMNIGREVTHYNFVLNIYASHYEHKSVLKIFQRMKELSDAGEKGVTPNRTTFNIVIKALSSSKMECVHKAEEILLEMENAYFDGNKLISPDKISYTSILAAWSRICNKQSVEKAEMYLERMQIMYKDGNKKVKPDTITYNTVLNIVSNSHNNDAGEKCLRILSSMEELHELGDNSVKPNLISYNAVMKAFSNNPQNDGARRSLMMLKKLENDEVLQPDIISYNSCLNAFAKARDPISAQLLVERMEIMYSNGSRVKPDTYTYNTLISAWAFCGQKYGAVIAETIFDRMETSQIRLDTTTFNTLLSAWGLQNDPERATDILHHMFAVKKSGQYDVRPTSQSFAIVINAWAKSKCPRKAFKAKELLTEMKNRSKLNKKLRPNTHIHATVLNACAFSFGTEEVKREALSIAIETFRECKHRNDVVYGTFIKACNNLIVNDDARRIEMIETAFVQCRQKGLVSDFVLHELFSSLSFLQYEKLCGSQDLLSVQEIPKNWCCNLTK